jgi:hypothetical protein
MKLGDQVIITGAGRTCHGVVTLASANGRSIMVDFEGMIGGHVGRAPLLMQDDGTWRSVIDNSEFTVTASPGYWMHETSGAFRPAVEAYLENMPMTPEHIGAMRAYLRQWVAGPWIGPLVDVLRTSVDEIATRADIDRWLRRAEEMNIDPL